jgi:hypothetical protein
MQVEAVKNIIKRGEKGVAPVQLIEPVCLIAYYADLHPPGTQTVYDFNHHGAKNKAPEDLVAQFPVGLHKAVAAAKVRPESSFALATGEIARICYDAAHVFMKSIRAQIICAGDGKKPAAKSLFGNHPAVVEQDSINHKRHISLWEHSHRKAVGYRR